MSAGKIKGRIKVLSTLFVLFALLGLTTVPEAQAVAQFSRKYKLSCSTCHTAFPRLNYYGEQFMQNGYQLPEKEDGSEVGKTKVSDRQVIDQVGNFFGVRLNVDVANVQTKSRTVTRTNNSTETDREPEADLGNTHWVGLFVAGSLYKNISLFIETELEDQKAKNQIYRLGFHNLLGQGGLANIRVGKFSMMDWHVASGRLRMISNVKVLATRYNSSDKLGEDSTNMSSSTQGVSFYGYTHGLTYQAGIFNGKADQTDPNRFKNYSGTLKYQLQDGMLEGSGFSVWGMYGTDTASYATSNIKNDFWRVSPGLNLRLDNNLDIIVAYFMGRDENYDFQADPTGSGQLSDNDMTGWTGQIGYNISPEFYAAVQYDMVEDEKNTQNSQRILPSLSYFIRENIRLSLTADLDLLDEESNIPQGNDYLRDNARSKLNRYTRKDKYMLNIRAMF
ncbi:MAG: hypothetical protein ACE5GM_08065 [bacterium]